MLTEFAAKCHTVTKHFNVWCPKSQFSALGQPRLHVPTAFHYRKITEDSKVRYWPLTASALRPPNSPRLHRSRRRRRIWFGAEVKKTEASNGGEDFATSNVGQMGPDLGEICRSHEVPVQKLDSTLRLPESTSQPCPLWITGLGCVVAKSGPCLQTHVLRKSDLRRRTAHLRRRRRLPDRSLSCVVVRAGFSHLQFLSQVRLEPVSIKCEGPPRKVR